MDSNQINELLRKIKSEPNPSQESVDDFINKNLSPSQASRLNGILSDPALVKSLLSSDKAKELLSKLTEGKNGH